MLSELTDEQAAYIGVPKQEPLQARYLPLRAVNSLFWRRCCVLSSLLVLFRNTAPRPEPLR